jgi:hypothetical protein
LSELWRFWLTTEHKFFYLDKLPKIAEKRTIKAPGITNKKSNLAMQPG